MPTNDPAAAFSTPVAVCQARQRRRGGVLDLSLNYVQHIADRYAPIDTAILFLGGVRHKPMLDAQLVTLDNTQATWVTRALRARRVIPAHFEGWAHFQGTRDDLTRAFDEANVSDRLEYA
ncbi:hypothetical protein ACVBEQ_03765 [Nakamurella sp. GG22]